ncbi:MAG: acyltransferase [Candidatus Coprovivens sp.]
MKRIAGLDIVRTIAILFVISVHYFLNTIFYKIPTTGKTMGILLSFRWLFFTCVPLFLLLTGYLSRNKEPNKKYFLGLKKVLTSYLFISIICILVRIFYFGEKRRILYWLISPFNFSADGYSWYIEMYIGLFLLAPFLNILYKGLEAKEKKQYLIIVFLLITSAPAIFNNYNILGLNKVELYPNWWLNLYPITYYFIGSYIGEYQPKVNKKLCIFYILLVLLIQTSCYYLLLDGSKFSWDIYGGYGSILTIILTILIFLTFYDIDIKNKIISKLITSISLCSLDMYLFSYLIDIKVYEKINKIATTPKKLMLYMFPTILLIFTICYIISLLKKLIFEFPEKIKNFKLKQKT